MAGPSRTVLAIDPGREKCGLALLRQPETGASQVLSHAVVPRAEIVAEVCLLYSEHQPDSVLIGNATTGRELQRELQTALPSHAALYSVPEAHTTERARTRYFVENPPRGLARLIPAGMRTPPVPVDDWAAVILGEDWLSRPETGHKTG